MKGRTAAGLVWPGWIPVVRKKGLHHPRLDGAAAAAGKGQTEELGGKKRKEKKPKQKTEASCPYSGSLTECRVLISGYVARGRV